MMQLREAREQADFETIARLADSIWREHYTPIIGAGQVAYMLDRFQSARAIAKQVTGGLRYFLISYQDVPAGYLAFERKQNSLFLSKIYVLRSFRGKGLGREAMTFVAEKARATGCQHISLTVNKYNSGSIAAYKQMGFRQGPAIQQDIGGGYIMDDYEMILDL